MDVAEPTLTCPYNKAHSIISSRMQFHLTKCRQQHPTNEKTICPFNSTHVIPHVEFNYHISYCPDRIVLDAFTCKVGSSSAPKVELAAIEPISIKSDENWEVSDDPPVSVLERVHETSKTKPTLQALIGAPKSERKAFRNQERLRIQRVLDSKEKNGEGSARKVEVGEGSGRKAEVGEGYGRKVQDNKGRNEIIGDESKVVNTTRNINYSHNRAMIADEDQRTDFENASVIQGSSRDAYRDPRNAWSTQKQNDFVRSTHFPKLIPRNTGGAGISNDARDEDIAAAKNSFVDVKFKPSSSPVRERDPDNPWRVNKSPLPTVKCTPDPGDFPMLPVASRGRGRDRVRAK